jgi:hypothetical protein
LLRSQGEAPRPPAIAAEITQFLTAAWAELDPDRAAAALAAGQSLDLAGTLDYALVWLE